MKCGRCGSAEQTILYQKAGAMNTIMRRRICKTCERVWTTRETVIQESVRDLAEEDFLSKRMLAKWRKEVRGAKRG